MRRTVEAFALAKDDQWSRRRGRVAVKNDVPVRQAQAWAGIGSIPISGDEIAKRKAER